jgi:hypothetical protein
VFELLLAVGADQAREMKKKTISQSDKMEQWILQSGMTCIHLDCLPEEMHSLQLKKLKQLTYRKMHAYVVDVSPESFSKDTKWQQTITTITNNDTLSFLCIDEAHMFVEDHN